jgi:hypothetical protein
MGTAQKFKDLRCNLLLFYIIYIFMINIIYIIIY